MSAWLLLIAWVWPLLLVWPAAGVRLRAPRADTLMPPLGAPQQALSQPLRGQLRDALPALGALPALVAALTLPLGTTLELPWLMLGTTLTLDAVARVYLLFTSILWLAAGIYAVFAFRGDPHAERFHALFLLAMAGNLWLIVGADLISFYVGFAMMGLSSYGLVVHNADRAALRAGKVYLVMALIGEVSLFAAFVMIVAQTDTLMPGAEDLAGLDTLTIALALLGLGVKAGLFPLHLWLPLAHPAAPIPASAVLSGTMIKVALLGWMRFLPVGAIAMPEWGTLLAAGGLVTLFFALPVGLVQSDPKVVLAYSSISKMGLLILLLGLILMEPALAPLGTAAIAFYAAHHALVKGGLFLGVGMRKHAHLQPLVLGLLVFLALALAGAPFTSGAAAKYEIKPLLESAHWTWISAAIAVSTFGTTLLMGRFIWVSVRTQPHPEPGYLWPAAAWGTLVGLVVLFPFVLGQPSGWLSNAVTVPAGIAAAVLIAAIARWKPGLFRHLVGSVPPGDLLLLAAPTRRAVAAVGAATQRYWRRIAGPVQDFALDRFERTFNAPDGDTERGLRQWPVAGALWIGISALMLLLLLGGQETMLPKEAPRTGAGVADTAAESQPDLAPAPERQTPRDTAAEMNDAHKAAPAPAVSAETGAETGADVDAGADPAAAPGPVNEQDSGARADGDGARQTEPARSDSAALDAPARSATSAEPESPRPQPAPADPPRTTSADDNGAQAPSPLSDPATSSPAKDDATAAEPDATGQAPRADSARAPAQPGPAEPSADDETTADTRGTADNGDAGDTTGNGDAADTGDTADNQVSRNNGDIGDTGADQSSRFASEQTDVGEDPCAPPARYVFAPFGDDPPRLQLDRCAPVGDQGLRALDAPPLTPALVRAVQRALNAAGYEAGPVDGIIGPRTRAALRALQRDAGFVEDGSISFDVLDALQPAEG
jgi:formate hydrogenlyase subunit 3/multisubunit Na+/H+ antiporter MnhD subunit